ncbi:Protein RecA [subsurface metagenome]|jgi:recombination protein RecA|nr:recombinase RecA [Clostridia bacterium]TET15860.1 MAG: recombinase RecA [Actinomycetota bacterium]
MDREKIIENTVSQIERQYGSGAIMKLGDKSSILDIGYISTNSLELDIALGIGGIPRGRVTEIFGPEASGKTTLALHIIANAQKEEGVAAFIDAEHALDPGYARNVGVNIEELLLSQPDNGEQALEICEILLKSGALDVIVIDSVAALVPKAELEGEMGDSHMGLQARLMSQALRKISGVVSKTRTSVVFINQLREKIGIIFGNPEVTPGGRALKFYASVRIDIRRIDSIKSGTDAVGNRIRARVVKNKVAPPFKSAEFDIMYGRGISREGSILDVGTEMGIIDKSGSWYSYKDERIGQGRENAKMFLMQNTKAMEEIEEKVKSVLNMDTGKKEKKDSVKEKK